jgi:hypothetical protein
LTDSNEVPQAENETEIEWVLMQGRPWCDEFCNPIPVNETENEPKLENETGSDKKSILRRYEFYEYTGEVNQEGKKNTQQSTID